MQLTPFRGRNQRGIAFVNPEASVVRSKVYSVSYRGRTIYCDLRKSHLVPKGILALDSRLFDELGCMKGEPVDLEESDAIPPSCQELSLSVESPISHPLGDNAESTKIGNEDIREHLDSLILRVGQRVRAPELGVTLVVRSASPLSAPGGLCRIVWSSIKNVDLLPTVQPAAFNLVCLLEFGVRSASASEAVGLSGGGPGVQMVADLIALLRNTGQMSLYAIVIYSTDTSTFVTYDRITGEEASLSESSSGVDVGALISWLEQQTPHHFGKPIRPSVGLERAIVLAKEASAKNGMVTAIAMFTRGTYSAGRNPVAVAARSSSEGRWGVFCIPLPGSRNLELISAIAEAGGGKMFEPRGSEELRTVIDGIQDWSGGASR